MNTSAVGASSVLTTQKATTRGFGDLGGQDFMSLMIAELQNQDPMNPTDNKELVAQMAGIRQMEQSSTLNETLQTLAAEQRFGSTTGLIGQYVAGTVTDSAGNGTEIQGLVIGVRYEKGNAILQLHNGSELPAEKVEQITVVDNLPADVQQQLQQELAAQAGTSGGDGGNSTTRLIRADAAPAPTKAGWAVRNLGRQADQTANLLDSLFVPVK